MNGAHDPEIQIPRYVHLAEQVLIRAYRDLVLVDVRNEDRRQVTRWIDDPESNLDKWADIAGVNPAHARRRLKHFAETRERVPLSGRQIKGAA